MSIKATLTTATTEAMRKQDKVRLATLRAILAAVKQKEVDSRQELDDPAVINILKKLAKQRKESIDCYQKAQREDLVQKEQAELMILQEFLPVAVDKAELVAVITQAITVTQAHSLSDLKKVIGHVKEHFKNSAVDMADVSAIAKAMLQNS